MTSEQITKFVEENHLSVHPLKIDFKTRQSIIGLFIKTPDYSELKSKNFWRIVAEVRIKEYKNTQDNNLARIFNGQEITKLSVPK
jgi:hypothetical protein